MDRMEFILLEVGSFSALFKSQKRMEGLQPPPPSKPIIPQNMSDRNFKRAVCSALLKGPVFGMLTSPQSSGQGL